MVGDRNEDYTTERELILDKLKQNVIDHNEIKEKLCKIEERYLNDVVTLKVQVKGIIAGIIILAGAVIALITRAIEKLINS